MSITHNFPMTLRELADELENAGIELMVHRASVEYDQHMVGFDVYATLECRALDFRTEDESPADAFDRAMEILGP